MSHYSSDVRDVRNTQQPDNRSHKRSYNDYRSNDRTTRRYDKYNSNRYNDKYRHSNDRQSDRERYNDTNKTVIHEPNKPKIDIMEQLKSTVDNSGVLDDTDAVANDTNTVDIDETSDNELTDEQLAEQRKQRRLQLLASVSQYDIPVQINSNNNQRNNGVKIDINSATQQTGNSTVDYKSDNDNEDMTDLSLTIQKQQHNHNNNTVNNTDTDDYDLFNDSPSKLLINHNTEQQPVQHNNIDNTTEFYQFKLNDKLNDGRYIVTEYAGSGVFSTVVRAIDTTVTNTKYDNNVVIKVIQANTEVLKAAQSELQILQLLQKQKAEYKHIIQLKGYFMHKNHLSLVFESLDIDLRKLNKKFGSVGLSMQAVKVFAKQLLVAQKFIHKFGLIHCDMKPDNILINKTYNSIKVSDFGSCVHSSTAITSSLVCSRFYRAPEIILGNCKYVPTSIDIWSVGCILYELYTGDILFQGTDNTDMLVQIMNVCGTFQAKNIRNALYYKQYFNDTHEFVYDKHDSVTQTTVSTIYTPPRVKYSIYDMLRKHEVKNGTHSDIAELQQLADCIEKCLVLDVNKRWTAEQLLKHTFITG